MKKIKKILSIFLIITLSCGLVGCALSDEQKAQKAENEKLAKPILEQFCENNFESYKINDIQGYHYTVCYGVPSEVLSDLVYADINIKKKSFKLYYDISTEEFYTDYYNTLIKDEIKESLLKIIPTEICEAEVEFYPAEFEDMGLTVTKIKDNKLENILNENYEIDITGHYDNIDSTYFEEDTIESKKDLLSKYNRIKLFNVYKCGKNINFSGDSLGNIKDSLYYSASNENITICHYEEISCDNFTLIYDKNSIPGIEVTTEKNTDAEPNTTYYSNYRFSKSDKNKYIINVFGLNQDSKTNQYIYIKFNGASNIDYCNIVNNNSHDMIRCSDYTNRYYTVYIKENNLLELSFWKCIDKGESKS